MIPPLFKFRTINEYSLDELRESYVYFSNVTTLNDPFEMGVYLDQVSDLEAARIEFVTGNYTGSPIEEILETMDLESRKAYLEMRWNCDEWREPFLEAWKRVDGFGEEMKRRLSIYCASATRTDGLLWAHYASGHRGIAIELNHNADEVLRKSLRVQYQREFPTINVHRDNAETKLTKSLLTKSKDWSYEQEYRTIFPAERENVKHGVDPSVFVSITFGAKISEADRDKVIDATRPNLSHIRFEQARLGKRTFSVEFEEYRIAI